MNKKNIKWLFILSVAFNLFSCNKFLEEVSQDEIHPRSVNDYSELIYGEIYFKASEASDHMWLDIMTDDCGEHAKKTTWGVDTREDGYGYYLWQKEPELKKTGSLNSDRSWDRYYHEILVANIVLYDVDFKEGSDSEKAQVKAEAYMIRAYAYNMLVNLYGAPYDPLTAEKSRGVPINNLIGAEDVRFKIASVAEVYRQINSDIESAMENFNNTSETKSIFRWNKNAANIFASRVALYTQSWDMVIKYANDAIATSPSIWDLNEKKENGTESDNRFFFHKSNPEIQFTFGSHYISYFATGAGGAFPASEPLQDLYEDGDLRCSYRVRDGWVFKTIPGAFIREQGSDGYFGAGKRDSQYKFDITSEASDAGVYGSVIRNAEAYINRAEAYSRKGGGDIEKTLADLNLLRKNRLTDTHWTKLTASTQDELIQLARDERRRELCFEQQRWFDLRRWDRPEITHIYTPNLTVPEKVSYTLKKDDPAYTLPIPISVIERDPDMDYVSGFGNLNRPIRKEDNVNETK